MTHALKRQHVIGLAFILIIGAALRFGNLDSSEFWYDEATFSSLAQSMADGKTLPLMGIVSSARIPNPPAGVYLLAIPYVFSKNPLVAVGFIALLNVVGVGLLWLIAQRYFGVWIAFAGGLLYAVSPWAVLYSRKIWGQDMHTPLVLAGFLLGLYGFVEGKRWAQMLCLPILVFAMQIHFAAWALLPAYGWLLWIGRKRLSRSAVVISVALAFLTLVPFLIGLTQAQTQYTVETVRDGDGLSLLPLEQIGWLTTGLDMGERFIFPPGAELVSQVPVIGVMWLGLIPLVGLGLWNVWRRSREYAVFLLLWGFLTPLSLVTGFYMSHPHYYIPCIPVYCLLAGEGIAWLVTRRIGKLQLRWATFAAVAAITVTQVVDWRSFLAFADANYVKLTGFINDAYATPLRYFLDIRAQLDDDVVMIAGSTLQALPDRWSPLLNGEVQCLREAVIADGGVAILPNHPFSLLRAPNATPYEFADLYTSAGQIVFPLRDGEGSYMLDHIEAPPQWEGPELTPIQPARFENGVRLDGYRFVDGRLYLDWSLTRPSAQDYQYFIHLLNADNQRIAQHDSSFYPGKFWCDGDRIITFVALEPPPGTTTLRIGMYRFDEGNITGSNVFDDAGNAAPWVDIPLTTG